ncbi:MAG: DUF87 domain-containing protein [Desulfurococcales archaeon]|nr:DUF87 domain-containing protein [Desulfurococcales archaeon]
MNYVSLIIALSLILIIRNIYKSGKPVIGSRVSPKKYSINADGILRLESSFLSSTNSLFCIKIKLNLPYTTLVSADKFSQISRKIAHLSTINEKIYSYIIDTYVPLDKRRTAKKLVNIKRYEEFIKSKTSDEYDHLISKINDIGFHNTKVIILCSNDTNELEKHIEFLGVELSSLLGSHPKKIVEKEIFRDPNLIVDLIKNQIAIRKNTIYDDFEALVTPGAPESSNNICIGRGIEGLLYCLKWVDDFERHVGIIGPTGAGKTTLLYIISSSFLKKKVNVNIIDPKGDLLMLLKDKHLTSYTNLNILNEFDENTVKKLVEDKPSIEKVLIIDEAWRVLPGIFKSNKAHHLFRESRSKKLRIIYATQNPWDLSSTVYSNTGTFIVFANQNLTYIRGVSEITGLGIEELSSLNTRLKFQAIVLRNGHFKPDRITIFKINNVH